MFIKVEQNQKVIIIEFIEEVKLIEYLKKEMNEWLIKFNYQKLLIPID